MINYRRVFLRNMSAMTGGLVLTACGGGSGDDAATSAASNSTNGVAKSAASSRSSSSGPSPDGTTIPSATSIIDKSGIVWTVVGGVVYQNGVPASSTSNVSLLLWYGGLIFQVGTGGQFYAWNTIGAWYGCSDPRVAVASTPGTFYGMNGHYDYTFTPAQIVSMLKALSCTIYRVGCVNAEPQLTAVKNIAQALQTAGLKTFALIDAGMYDTNGKLYTSESIAYSQGYSNGAAVAATLMPYGVTMYECGNELTRDSSIIVNSAYAGNKPSDFNNTNWPIMRGLMRGMIAGVKSVQPTAKCAINFTVVDIAAADCLWNGMQPDGSRGYPVINWDITTWHNYQVYGDIFDIGTDGAGPGINLPVYCKARYGVPFMLSEWNANPEDTETVRASYVTEQLGEFYQARNTDNIQSVMLYELDSGDDTYGVVTNAAVPIQPTYNALQSFADANAD